MDMNNERVFGLAVAGVLLSFIVGGISWCFFNDKILYITAFISMVLCMRVTLLNPIEGGFASHHNVQKEE